MVGTNNSTVVEDSIRTTNKVECAFLDQETCGGMAALLADPTFTLGLFIWLVIITIIYFSMVFYILFHRNKPHKTESPSPQKHPPSLPSPVTTPTTSHPVKHSTAKPLPSSAFSTWIGSLRDDQVMEWQNPTVTSSRSDR